MRRMIDFDCAGDGLVGTLDEAEGKTGLLIVSGGNEIRSGAYAGQAAMAQHFANSGFPVLRFDRRGVGDSEGSNNGFEGSRDDLIAAIAAFRREMPGLQRVVAFGICDAATALGLFHADLAIDALLLANPWVIQAAAQDDAPTPPSASAIRARYWAKLKNPKSLLDLVTGKIDIGKLAGGLKKAARPDPPSELGQRLAEALLSAHANIHIMIAERDTTALAFLGIWNDELCKPLRSKPNVRLARFATASHSFAEPAAREWLFGQIEAALNRTG